MPSKTSQLQLNLYQYGESYLTDHADPSFRVAPEDSLNHNFEVLDSLAAETYPVRVHLRNDTLSASTLERFIAPFTFQWTHFLFILDTATDQNTTFEIRQNGDLIDTVVILSGDTEVTQQVSHKFNPFDVVEIKCASTGTAVKFLGLITGERLKPEVYGV